MSKDYYAILGVSRTATQAQVRQRFLELARVQHPDRFQGEAKSKAEADFQEITQAFNMLSDPARRREVDDGLAQPDSSAAVEDTGEAAKVYMRRGIKAYREGNYVAAVESFELATEADPSDARAWSYLAQTCEHRRRWWVRARKAATKACQLEPMNATYLKLAGRIFARAEMFERAEKYYVAAQDWGEKDDAVEAALADIRRRKKKSGGGLFGG